MTNMKNGEQSIHIITDSINNEYISGGLTKREYFASMAMQGLLSRESAIPNLKEMPYNIEMAIKSADELLKQLSNEQ